MRCWIEVSRGRLTANYHAVKQTVGPDVEVCPVVKADAYGHGAVEVTRVLERAGARWFAVSSFDEGAALREAAITEPRILVMADSLAAAPLPDIVTHRLTPAIHSLDDLALLNRLGAAAGKIIDFHLKIDSGMGRLGTRAAAGDIARAILAAPNTRLEGAMTHLASAADYQSGQTEAQLARFAAVLDTLPVKPRLVHTSATVPVAYARTDAWRAMVRPGHAIYGYVSPIVKGAESAPARGLHVRPALSWKTRLLAVKEIPAGEPIGYGAMFTATAPMRIGILGAGYADGIPHRLGNKGKVIAGGHLAPMVGAVSMDVTTVDLTGAPAAMKPGDVVTLLGEEGGASIDAQQIARLAGTISYSVLCGISARVAHVYVD